MQQTTVNITQKRMVLALVAKIGKQIKEELPGIAEAYRQGSIQEEIVREFNICNRYNTSLSIAKSAVATAIRGFPGNRQTEPYVGLIKDPEERAQIAKEHVANGMTLEQRVELGRRMRESRSLDSLKKTGQESYNNRVGIHALTSNEKADAARLSCISQGKTPWEPAESRFAYLASQLPEYQISSSKANSTLIAQELNELFHEGKEVRSGNTVSRKLIDERHKLQLPKRIFVPWGDEEKEYVTSTYGASIKSYKEALADINKTFHGGQEVRTKPGLNKFITAYRKQLSESNK